MSDEALMRGILVNRLLTLGWANQTAFEGKGFAGAQPDATTPYQEPYVTFATPLDRTLAGPGEYRGEFQVRLLWPVSQVRQNGTGAPSDRAKQIKALFPRNLILTSGAQRVKILSSPLITRGPVQGDRDVTLIRFRFGDR